nr:UbiH/UbiF/VisC/COQ6 family ubiquinone biosynthesis hydroxylase [Profundibacterium mesophilum]
MEHRVIIAGGGLGGMTLALALASAGIASILVDPAPATASGNASGRAPFDGRSYALSAASVNLLRALSLWEGLAETAQPILQIKVSDGRAGEGPSPFVMEFDHAELEEGPMGHMVEDRHLRPALEAALARMPLCSRVEDSVTGQRALGDGIEVGLAGGARLRAALLVGSDGRQSPTGRRAGITRLVRDYGQGALVTSVEHARPHEGIAHQFFTPEGPLAILPLRGNRSSIVWTERAARAETLMAADDAQYLAALEPRFGDFLGGISLAGARFGYPLGMSLARSFVAPRVALLGDAAHAVHPIAGQGLNAGLKDVAALAQVLRDAARRGEDIGRADVLDRYQQWRRFDATALALATDGFNRLFSNDNAFLRLGRDLGMGIVGAVPALRRGAMREAAGLTGARPLLLRGLPL